MSNYFRIIPKFEIKNDNLVKGVRMEGLRVLGKCSDFAKLYYEDGADEIFYQDIVASLYGQNNLLDLIQKTASNLFIPLTVGGGIRNIDDIKKILSSGADKVALNSILFKNIQLLKDAANIFGSSTVVGSVEGVKKKDGEYYSYFENGRTSSNIKVIDWIEILQKNGIGEIFLTFVDYDGLNENLDLNFLKKLNNKIHVPFIVQGGISNVQHIYEISKIDFVDGISASSLFHYNYIDKVRSLCKSEFNIGNTDFLSSYKKNSKNDISIKDIKSSLLNLGVNCLS
jgi:imidazole glycerol-phosphate synthase subunit HisF